MRSAFYNLVNFINMTGTRDVYGAAAKIILQNIYKIPNCNIVDVAKMCYVSTATISRLCRKLNYESFAEFKNDVIDNLNYFNEDAKRFLFDYQLPEKELIYEGKQIFKEHFENVINNLQQTYDSILYEDLMLIVDKIYAAKRIYFFGNFFTQSVSMQLQIALSYLGKECIAMYSLEKQKEVIANIDKDDLIIVSSIAGSFLSEQLDTMRMISKTSAYIVVITQAQDFPYCDKVDKILKVGNSHRSLIGKFSITYIFEVIEALYHIKYSIKENK